MSRHEGSWNAEPDKKSTGSERDKPGTDGYEG